MRTRKIGRSAGTAARNKLAIATMTTALILGTSGFALAQGNTTGEARTAVGRTLPSADVCVTYGHGGTSAAGNIMLWNWDHMPCPSGTYPETLTGGVGPQGPQGVAGPQGPQGIQGPAGQASQWVPPTEHFFFAVPAGVLGNSAAVTLQEICSLQPDSGPGTQNVVPQYQCQYAS